MSKVEQSVAAVGPALTLGASFISLTDSEATSYLAEHFGIDGAVTRLPTEKDDTFRIDLPGGGRQLLKVANPFEDESELAFECELLQHVAAADPLCPIPRLVPTLEGGVSFCIVDGKGQRRFARVLTYLEGSL